MLVFDAVSPAHTVFMVLVDNRKFSCLTRITTNTTTTLLLHYYYYYYYYYY